MLNRKCPVCRGDNNCQLGEECWCENYLIPSILFYLADDETCICKSCIEYFIREEKDFIMLENIFTRRSIRKFTGKKVDEKDLRLILKAGFQAPSAHNKEPREYIIVRDRDKIDRITEVHKYGKMLPEAGCGIVVCGDRNKQERLGHLVADCSASIENMLLAAHSLGLGGVWTGIHPIEDLEDNFREILSIPEDMIPIGMVVIGHTDLELDFIDRYDKSKIHYDKW